MSARLKIWAAAFVFAAGVISGPLAPPAAAQPTASSKKHRVSRVTPPRSTPSRARQATPLQATAEANVAARQRPHALGFVAARHVFAYAPGALFELHANPGFVSTILLEPGETLADIAAGDTSRWMVTEAVAESEAEPRTVVLVKPRRRVCTRISC